MTIIATFLLLLLIVGRCSWELIFLESPGFERSTQQVNSGSPLVRGLALLSGLVSLVLLLEAAPVKVRVGAVILLAVTQTAYWFSSLGKANWGRGLNFLFRLLISAGIVFHFLLAWKMRADLKNDTVLVAGIVVLVPVISGMLLLIELLFNAALSHGRKFSWKFLAEAGTVAAVTFLLFQLQIIHHA
ncbi:MAG: hypothetical protein FD123_2308 [Bacteroidetes bacterium]|nr:MAG: hypothetical protein FD123_2308 [Bacteroidota bacterium]